MDIKCGACGSENLTRDPDAPPSADIPLLCSDCGWRGRRTPKISCPRCGSLDVDETAVDSWAYADLEESRENPESAVWGYVEKTAFRCRKCHKDWSTAGPYRPYPASKGAAVVAFVDDDAGYHEWLRTYPKGFVLNCNRQPSSGYRILHRATCPFISRLGANMATFTGEYIKICSTDRAAVRQGAFTNAGAEGTPCQHCF